MVLVFLLDVGILIFCVLSLGNEGLHFSHRLTIVVARLTSTRSTVRPNWALVVDRLDGHRWELVAAIAGV